jgi:stringent starvation protein B
MSMTSNKPYLIRAIYEWIIDNKLTPHLLVDASHPNALLPEDFIDDGKIVLNIRPEAIQGMLMGNDNVEFNARFSGQPMHIVAPVNAILAIYAKENGKGMVFDPNEGEQDNPPPPPAAPAPKKPTLRVVK